MTGLSDLLLQLRATPAGRRKLMTLDTEAEARRLCDDDPHGEGERMHLALERAGAASPDALRDWYRHLLGCMGREAAFIEVPAFYEPPLIKYEGARWLAETEGRPTMLVSPMTQALPDVMEVMSRLAETRPLVVYGESLSVETDPRLAMLSAGHGLQAVRRIARTLREGGVLCTYLDFLYDGHAGVPVTLFGQLRPLSSGYLSLAMRHGAHLLPAVMTFVEGVKRELRVSFDEPVAIPPLYGDDAVRERPFIARMIAGMLEALVARAPTQWLLLPTLSFDMPQVSRSGAWDPTETDESGR
jgi:hypothetical protein